MAEMTFKDFLRDVNNIYKKNCAVYYKLASHYGLTETMFDILYFVRENEDCTTQAQICNNLYLRKQTVNTALKKLEKKVAFTWRRMLETERIKPSILRKKEMNWLEIR